MNEQELALILEVMVAARLYGHDLRFVAASNRKFDKLLCSRCAKYTQGTLEYIIHGTRWEDPCRGTSHTEREIQRSGPLPMP